MDWNTIGEIVLGIITAVVGGGSISLHVRHKSRSKGYYKELEEIKIKIAVMKESRRHELEDIKAIKKSISNIEKQLKGGK